MTALFLILHLLSAVVWVGGMFFAYVCLRFFPWVWLSVAAIVISGHGMIALSGGMAGVGKHVHIMMVLGYLMIGLYLHVYFALFGKLQRFVAAQLWAEAGATLNKIRIIIGINLMLGLVVVAVGSGGRYLFA
jgi:uncharacterized membrane protein